jgi:hypothetical protein
MKWTDLIRGDVPRDSRRRVSRLKRVESEGFATLQSMGPMLCREDRERRLVPEELDPKPSAAP